MFQTLMKMADESVRQMQSSHARLLESVVPAQGKAPEAAHPALAPVKRLNNYQAIMSNLAARQVRMAQDMWAVACNPVADGSLLVEMFQMQQAVFRRLADQQAEAMRGLATIASGAAHMKKVNTVSKLMEEEYDFFAQLNAFVVAQATAYVELAENIQVNAGYLLTRKAESGKR